MWGVPIYAGKGPFLNQTVSEEFLIFGKNEICWAKMGQIILK